MGLRIPVVIVGAGGVGRALLQQIIDGRHVMAMRNAVRFDVVSVFDSSSCRCSDTGLDDAELADIIQRKSQGKSLSAEAECGAHSLDNIIERSQTKGILVDVTASGEMVRVLRNALENGWGVALANKKPLAGPWQASGVFYNNPFVRHESTVGGGQPVIATLRYLKDVNDTIYRIEGQMSGCLGFICGAIEQGTSFSDALSEARKRGYTEPDPREDLGGRDALRKILILGRMAGWAMESTDVEVEGLYPSEMGSLSVDEFMNGSNALDKSIGGRFSDAARDGNTLRYVAYVENGIGRIGLQAVPVGSALSNLKYVSFRTELYNDEPLLIAGKGAGVEMTAAGVLGDMVSLAREVLS